MKSYNVYHLVEKSLPRCELLELNKRPEKLDLSIIDCYCITKSAAINVNNKDFETSDDFNGNKIELVKELKNKGGYIHVATVKANEMLDVIRSTSSINTYWYLTINKNVEVINSPWRDTGNNDLIICEDDVKSIIFGIGTIDY